MLENGSIVDTRPGKLGKPDLIVKGGSWVPFTGNAGDAILGTPLTAEEIARLCPPGTLPQ